MKPEHHREWGRDRRPPEIGEGVSWGPSAGRLPGPSHPPTVPASQGLAGIFPRASLWGPRAHGALWLRVSGAS